LDTIDRNCSFLLHCLTFSISSSSLTDAEDALPSVAIYRRVSERRHVQQCKRCIQVSHASTPLCNRLASFCSILFCIIVFSVLFLKIFFFLPSNPSHLDLSAPLVPSQNQVRRGSVNCYPLCAGAQGQEKHTLIGCAQRERWFLTASRPKSTPFATAGGLRECTQSPHRKSAVPAPHGPSHKLRLWLRACHRRIQVVGHRQSVLVLHGLRYILFKTHTSCTFKLFIILPLLHWH
jgi:hypothetical protein